MAVSHAAEDANGIIKRSGGAEGLEEGVEGGDRRWNFDVLHVFVQMPSLTEMVTSYKGGEDESVGAVGGLKGEEGGGMEEEAERFEGPAGAGVRAEEREESRLGDGKGKLADGAEENLFGAAGVRGKGEAGGEEGEGGEVMAIAGRVLGGGRVEDEDGFVDVRLRADECAHLGRSDRVSPVDRSSGQRRFQGLHFHSGGDGGLGFAIYILYYYMVL